MPKSGIGATKSILMQEDGKRFIPGMTQLLSKRPDQFTSGVWPGYFERAKGAHVWDLDGKQYLDMSISGIGANVLGYADPDVDAAVVDAIRRGVSSSLNCPEEVQLAERLIGLHPWADMVRYTRSGGEAMAVAVRLARVCTGRDRIAFSGYHGWHDWYLAANLGDKDALGSQLLPGLDPAGVPNSLRGSALPFHYNQLDELKDIISAHGKEIAAVVMEPQRNAEPDPGFLEGCKRLAQDCGAVLIFDEISAGFRINTGGIHLCHGVAPDVAVFSKALGNGYAIAAVIGTAAVMEAAQQSFISSTNWTERIGPVAALATIEKHERLDVGTRLTELGMAVQAGWRMHAEAHGLAISVGGLPPLSHFEFEIGDPLEQKALFVQEMIDRGILASTLYYAMYAHTEGDVREYLEAVDEAFSTVATAAVEGRVREMLRGMPAAAGFARLS